MSQELGRLERPAAQQYAGKRKLLLLPLIQAPGLEVPAASRLLLWRADWGPYGTSFTKPLPKAANQV